MHFLRHTPADIASHRSQIEAERRLVAAAVGKDDKTELIEHLGNLGAMLTSDRKEHEAYELLASYLPLVRERRSEEPSAWLIHALATSAQYIGNYEEANALFAEAFRSAKENHWRVLEHFVLHHWGRCLAEQSEFSGARECFEASLVIRLELSDPRQESSKRALLELAKLQA